MKRIVTTWLVGILPAVAGVCALASTARWFRMRTGLSIGYLCAVCAIAPAEQPLGQSPIDPGYLQRVTFGTYSHWLQPWRGYLETMPASHFLNGLGIVLNTHRGEDTDQLLRMCASNGLKHVRIEIGWGSLRYEDETRLNSAKQIGARLLACRKYGLRPLVLLNGHHGAPCPLKSFERVVRADAAAGSREVQLDKIDGLVIGHSGLSSSRRYVAAELLITAIIGHRVRLSKPLPEALKGGTKVWMATLKYAPFGPADSDEGKATLDGWKRYATTVARFVADELASAGREDLGFDLEIWNEMSFGSNFIHQRHYYDPLPRPYDEKGVYLNIVRATAEAAEAAPQLFRGVRLVNGFSNTLPWPASAQMPTRISALSHHPYAGRRVYPALKSKGMPLNARGLKDTSGFQPSYEACFPEYFATALQTETITRDMAPLTTEIYRLRHGRNTRPGNPCWCWITEVNYAPGEDAVRDQQRALALKAKAILRYYCFYLNKGVERLYLYAVAANDPKLGDTELGVLRQDFVERTITEKQYPTDDASWTAPALQAVRRVVTQFNDGLDAGLGATRPLRLETIADRHDHQQFEGDPRDYVSRPPLYNRDVFAFLPFQVNAKKFVIPCYVVTCDIRKELPQEAYMLVVKGLRGDGAKVSLYDPLLDRQVVCSVSTLDADRVQIEVRATDYPRLLIVEEP